MVDFLKNRDNVAVLGLVKTTDAAGMLRSVAAIEGDIQLYKDHVPAISGVYIDEGGHGRPFADSASIEAVLCTHRPPNLLGRR